MKKSKRHKRKGFNDIAIVTEQPKSRLRKRKKRKGSQKRKQDQRKKRSKGLMGEVKLLILVLMVIVLLLVGVSSLFYAVKQVSGYGMMPSLRTKDVLLIKRQSEFKRFDIAVINKGMEGEFRRIIGLPGEKISYEDDTLLVNGEPVDEKFLVDKVNESQLKGKNFTEDTRLFAVARVSEIPKDSYLVLGDNRPYTTDSRDYGLVTRQEIRGKIIARLWPLESAERF